MLNKKIGISLHSGGGGGVGGRHLLIAPPTMYSLVHWITRPRPCIPILIGKNSKRGGGGGWHGRRPFHCRFKPGLSLEFPRPLNIMLLMGNCATYNVLWNVYYEAGMF